MLRAHISILHPVIWPYLFSGCMGVYRLSLALHFSYGFRIPVWTWRLTWRWQELTTFKEHGFQNLYYLSNGASLFPRWIKWHDGISNDDFKVLSDHVAAGLPRTMCSLRQHPLMKQLPLLQKFIFRTSILTTCTLLIALHHNTTQPTVRTSWWWPVSVRPCCSTDGTLLRCYWP